jgi:protein-S-isoprenylcysteine O-methyltransferase Ste14
MKTSLQTTIASLIVLLLFGAVLFLPAWTINYWQAWVFLIVMIISSGIPVIYLMLKNPAALQRRMQGGPTAETRPAQKIISSITLLLLPTVIVFSAFDHRFGWSPVPLAISVLGNVLVALGISLTMLVIIQNNYAAATIRVEDGQQLTTTGLYGLVRHPMYVGILIMMAGTSLALDSWWGLAILLPATIAFILRILDEEKMLTHELPGYPEYTHKVHYRIVPYIW